MAFQKFTNRNSKSENRITITKSNSIGFPTQFYKENGIGQYKSVFLFWDNGTTEIGLLFTNEKDSTSFNIIKAKKDDHGGFVSAKSFFKFYNIDPLKYHDRYEWRKENIDGVGELFIVKLKQRE